MTANGIYLLITGTNADINALLPTLTSLRPSISYSIANNAEQLYQSCQNVSHIERSEKKRLSVNISTNRYYSSEKRDNLSVSSNECLPSSISKIMIRNASLIPSSHEINSASVAVAPISMYVRSKDGKVIKEDDIETDAMSQLYFGGDNNMDVTPSPKGPYLIRKVENQQKTPTKYLAVKQPGFTRDVLTFRQTSGREFRFHYSKTLRCGVDLYRCSGSSYGRVCRRRGIHVENGYFLENPLSGHDCKPIKRIRDTSPILNEQGQSFRVVKMEGKRDISYHSPVSGKDYCFFYRHTLKSKPGVHSYQCKEKASKNRRCSKKVHVSGGCFLTDPNKGHTCKKKSCMKVESSQ